MQLTLYSCTQEILSTKIVYYIVYTYTKCCLYLRYSHIDINLLLKILVYNWASNGKKVELYKISWFLGVIHNFVNKNNVSGPAAYVTIQRESLAAGENKFQSPSSLRLLNYVNRSHFKMRGR